LSHTEETGAPSLSRASARQGGAFDFREDSTSDEARSRSNSPASRPKRGGRAPEFFGTTPSDESNQARIKKVKVGQKDRKLRRFADHERAWRPYLHWSRNSGRPRRSRSRTDAAWGFFDSKNVSAL